MRVLLLLVVLLVCGSCFEKGDCVVNNTNLIKIDFINTSDQTVHTITFTSITVEGTSIELYNDGVAVSTIELPVDPTKTETTFILNQEGEDPKKMVVTYRNQTTIPSAECGALIYQDQVTIVENPFPENITKIVTTQLLLNASVNFEIYF